MTIFGWDASDFDQPRGPMDLAAARRDGIDFFTHKATEGTGTRHRFFGEMVRRARDAGVPFIGAYGVPRTGSLIAAQVEFFLSYVTAQAPWWQDFPGWFFQCDLEHWSYDAVPPAVGVEWCRQVRERTGRQVLLYAPEWAYSNGIGGSDPLWESAYGANLAGPYRALYPGDNSIRWNAYSGRTPVVLQYASKATIGSQPNCDANAFRGSVDDFARLIGAATIQRKDEEMAILAKGQNGDFYLCAGGFSHPIAESNIADIRYLAGQGAYTLAHGTGDSAEWTGGGWVRLGWSPAVFGPVWQPVQVGGVDLDALAGKVAARIGVLKFMPYA